MSATINSYPKLLATDPKGEDLFTGHSQTRIASAIAGRINQNDCALIGLDGPWGSGKSNLIKMLERQLPDATIFVYDAWSHQEDLQRRSFLEELTAFVTFKKLVNQAVWDDKLKDLLAKKKTIVTKDIPHLSLGIIFTFLLALLIPLIKDFRELFEIKDKGWGVFILLLPFLIATALYVFAKKRRKEKLQWADFLALYNQERLSKTTDEQISEREPSVREFRKWMFELSAELKKPLIVVFDNMDRLPAARVQQLWSNIHTFFASEPYPNISVIVPFDRDEVSKAFATPDIGPMFINKTFPVVFNMSPAPLTDWKQFFTLKFSEAFGPDMPEDEAETTAMIYAAQKRNIMPREIIVFINEIVSMKFIWKDQVDMKYLSLFAATRREYFQDGRQSILDTKYAQGLEGIFKGDENLPGIMAALYYNIDIDKAAEVILFRDLQAAFRKGDIETLKKLSTLAHFDTVLQEVLIRGGIRFDYQVRYLKELQESIKDEALNKKVQRSWRTLIGYQLSQEQTHKDKFENEDRILLVKSAPVGFIRSLVDYFCRMFAEARDITGHDYARAVMSLEKCLVDNNLHIQVKNHLVKRKLLGRDYLSFVEEAKDRFADFEVTADVNDLEETIISFLPDRLTGNVYIGPYLSVIPFVNLKQRIEQVISANEISLTNVSELYELYRRVYKEGQLMLPTDQVIHNLLIGTEDGTSQFYELATMRLSRGQHYETQGGFSTSIVGRATDDFISQVVGRIFSFVSLADLFIMLQTFNKPAIRGVLKCIVENKLGSDQELDLTAILPTYEMTRDLIEVSDAEFMSFLNAWLPKLPAAAGIDLPALMPNPVLIPAWLDVDIPISLTMVAMSLLYISQRSSEEWKPAFLNPNSYLFRLVDELVKSGKIDKMPEAALAPFREILLETAETNESILFQAAAGFDRLYKISDKTTFVNTIPNIRDAMIRLNDTSAVKFLFYEPFFREQGELKRAAGDVTRTILVPTINNDTVFDRLVKNEPFYIDLLASAGLHAVDVINEIRAAAESGGMPEGKIQFLQKLSAIVFKPFEILHAHYFSSVDSKLTYDVTIKLKEWTKTGEVFHFKLQNSIAPDDPHYGVSKILSAVYRYRGEQLEKNFKEESWVRLP